MRFGLVLVAGVAITLAAGCGSAVSAGGDGGSGGAGGSTTATTGTTTPEKDAGPSCADPTAPAIFEIGTGETCFERLTAGQTVKVLSGPQGGYHVWLAVGCGDCGSQAIVEYGVKDPATHTWYPESNPSMAVVELDAVGWGQRAGLTDFLPGVPWQPETALPKGTHILIAVTVLDMASTKKHEADIEVVLGDVESWAPPCDPGPNCGAPGGLPCCLDGK